MKQHGDKGSSSAANCSHPSDCKFYNHSLEKRIMEFASLGAVPHCCFAELLGEQVVAGLTPEADGAVGFYATMTAFYEKNPDASGHCHGTFAWLVELFVRENALRLHGSGGIAVDISAPEAAKLLVQVEKYFENEKLCHCEEIDIADGEQMVFSTPDPELPAGFIEYLETVFSPLSEVAAVHVFSACKAGDEHATLTIGIEPAAFISREEADRLSFLIVEGVERFLEDHDQLDFLLIEDEELAEIARSVSPAINLDRKKL